LSDRQILYALSDVSHLRPIYEHFARELEQSGRRSWLDEEMAALIDPAVYNADPAEAWRKLRPRSGKPRFLAILKELAAWREREAQKRDLPRGRLLRDDALLEIAAHAPDRPEELGRLRSLNPRIAEGPFGGPLIEAVKRGQATPEADCPRLPESHLGPQGAGPLVDLLRVLLKLRSEQSGVAPRMIASTDDLERLATGEPADLPALHGWRLEVFGTHALALKDGRLAFASEGGQIILLERLADGTLTPAAAPVKRRNRSRRR
jgi:ribonuclease D